MQPSSGAPTFPSGVKSYMIIGPYKRYTHRDMEALNVLKCMRVVGTCKREDTVRRSLEEDGFFLGKRLLQGVDEVQNLLKHQNGAFSAEDNPFFLYEVKCLPVICN
jgi:hypothetical protein